MAKRHTFGIPTKDNPSKFCCPNCKTELQVDYEISLPQEWAENKPVLGIKEQQIQECIWFDGITINNQEVK